MPLFGSPGEESSQHDQATVDGGDSLASFAAQPVFEVGHVAGRHPLEAEWLGVSLDEPGCELPHVLEDHPPAVGSVVLVAQVARHQGGLARPNRNGPENVITPILTGLFARIRHDLGTPLA